jgi:hypothetical protein
MRSLQPQRRSSQNSLRVTMEPCPRTPATRWGSSPDVGSRSSGDPIGQPCPLLREFPKSHRQETISGATSSADLHRRRLGGPLPEPAPRSAATLRVGRNGAPSQGRDVVCTLCRFSPVGSISARTVVPASRLRVGYGWRSGCAVIVPRNETMAYTKGGRMEGFEMAVFTTQRADVAVVGGGRRSRRRPPVPSYGWHLIHAERPLTWCGLAFSYAFSQRRFWKETPEDQRCRSCVRRLEQVSHTNTSQRTAGIAAKAETTAPE